MIPESEWLCCQAPECGKPIRPHRKEGRKQYALRRYCSRQCADVRKLQAVVLRECGNPDCSNLVPRDPGMRPNAYAKRRCCSIECTRRLQSLRAIARGPKHFVPRPLPAPQRAIISGARVKLAKPVNEADAIAAFIAQRGITYCPPKYVAVTLNAALPDGEATAAIKRLRLPVDTGWKSGSKRSYARVHGQVNI